MKRLLVWSLLLIAGHAHSITGNDLLDRFREHPLAGLSYVQGAVNTASMMNGSLATLAEQKGQPHPFTYRPCIPDAVTVGQVVDVVKKYLEANPARRHQDAGLLVYVAVTEAFPCK